MARWEVVEASAILGSWQGFAVSTGHPVERVLEKSRWHGKPDVVLANGRHFYFGLERE